jgi:flagellar biosynthesis activator protein FlaF
MKGNYWIMQNAAEAYSQTAKESGSAQEREAALLIKAALRLQHVKDAGASNAGALYQALHYNRKLWTVFVSSVAKDDNPLPQEIKNGIASLGLFIFTHTLEVQAHPEPEMLTSLININREIAAGLREQVS